MTKGQMAWREIAGSSLLALGGVALALDLNAATARADPPIPFVTTSSGGAATTVPTPTLPAHLALLAPAFALAARSGDLAISISWLPADATPLVAYRPDAASPWYKIRFQIDEETRRIVVPNAPPGEYALVEVSAAAPLPSNGVVVDDLSAGFARYGPSGNWRSVTSQSHYYLGHAYWTSNTTTIEENWGVWTTFALNGFYEVLAFVPSNYADTTHGVYCVQHDNQSHCRAVNQSIYWAEWVSLGVYRFSAATAGYVELTDVTGEAYGKRWVAFDAVAFVPQKTYLPLVMRNWPSVTPAPKQWSGMHVGNRLYGDWSSAMLAPFSPGTGGAWPQVVVAQSDQVFTINREQPPPTGTCQINGVSVKNWTLYNYLEKAAQAGARVVIRIHPSPGNFQESILPGWDKAETRPTGRTLITTPGVRPGGWLQCGNEWRFRPVDDVGDEMLAIQRFVLWWSPPGHTWSVYGFEPANEPNTEWYGPPYEGASMPEPSYFVRESWQAMDQYFANLYDYVKANSGYVYVRVLTPPMAQNAYAEKRNVNSDTCPEFGDFVGYEQMVLTFNSTNPKNDGYTWHNYWAAGRERWADCPNGQHVSMWFPTTMMANIRNGVRPAIITEADLASPQQNMGNTITDKDSAPGLTAASLRDFVYNEQLAGSVAFWMLNDDTGSATDHTWHQAYNLPGGFRAWFTQWWGFAP